MELRHLRYFLAVASELSFTRAAANLHTSQSSLSCQIRDLEACVGVPLLERNKRKVLLTPAGETFLHDTQTILLQVENAKKRACRAMASDERLVIGFVPAAEVNVLPKILPKLRMSHPLAEIELVSLITTQQEEKLLSGEIDIGFMRPPVVSEFLDSALVHVEPLLVALEENHPLANEEKIDPEKLQGVDFISTDPIYSGSLNTIVSDYLNQQNCVPNVVQVATNILVTMNLVAMGIGVTLVPEYTRLFSSPNVRFRPLSSSVPSIELLMAWRKDNTSSLLAEFLASMPVLKSDSSAYCI